MQVKAEAVSRFDGAALFGCVLVSTLVLSAAAYQWVERPAIVLGNRICGWMARRSGTGGVRSMLVAAS